MGYISSVVIYIVETEEVLNKLGVKSLDEILPIMNEAYADGAEVGYDNTGARVLRAEWYGTKWYDGCTGYDEVNRVMELLGKLDEDSDYSFARLGEEFGDFESKGDLFEIYPSTSIDEDWVPYYGKSGYKPQSMYINCGNVDATLSLICKENMSVLTEIHEDKTVLVLTKNHNEYAKAVQNIQNITAYNTVNNPKYSEYKLETLLNRIQNMHKAKDETSNIEYSASNIELGKYGKEEK